MSKVIKVAVDDGHGLTTLGKQTPSGYKENEFNHWTKEYLIEELERNGFKVIDCSPTRKDDALSTRTDICNNENADIFISIHFNALKGKWGEWGGIESYCYVWGGKGEKLTRLIHKYLMQGTKLKNRGVKTANFYVLRNTRCPACLVECGFMDNRKEAELMKSTNYRKECAKEICQGICEYFKREYIPEKTTETGFEITEDCIKILNKISKYDKIWIEFIKNNKHVNLSGLIENAYYYDEYKSKYIDLVENIRNKINEFDKLIKNELDKLSL